MKYNRYQNINNQLLTPKKIVLSAHANPDGDTIGSCIALYHYLTQFGHQVIVISPNEAPGFLQWLQGYEQVLIYDNDTKKAESEIDSADLIFAVDYNAFHRTGAGLETLLDKASAIKILIDHHPNPDGLFDVIISDTSSSSTAEMIFRFIEDSEQLDKINKDVAAGLYVGLLTDTGSFSFSINSDKPYKMAAFLYNTGIDIQAINQRIYSAFTESRLRLTGYAISEKLVVNHILRFAYISLSKAELDRFNHQNGDTESLVNYALSLENIVAAVLLTEKEGTIRLSFRSKGKFAVNEIASEYFEGGGHRNAAGGNSFVTMEETIQKLNKILSQYKNQLAEVQL
ncbi:MAG: DHH family phosphoesterase [Bacteroidales bacterium]|nr:DHH family phosphoesterase [Bacteroidales bacterium]